MNNGRASTSISTHRAKSTARGLSLTTAGTVTLLLGLLCVAALILNATVSGRRSNLRDPLFASLVVAALLILDGTVERRYQGRPPRMVGAVAVAAHALSVEAVTWTDGLTYTLVLYLTLPFPTFFLLGRRAGIAVSGGLLAWFTGKFILFKPGWTRDPATINTYLLFSICLVVITAMANAVLRERRHRMRTEELLHELEASHTQLEHYANRVAELATIEERNRVAREIHDSIGHSLTVVGVQLEKALAVADDSPHETLTAIRTAQRLNGRALTDVRRSVGALRRSRFTLRPALEALIADLEGLPFRVDLEFEGEESLLSRPELLALYRSVQEGLTNVQKHAHARHVCVTVTITVEGATLIVEDDGVGLPERGDTNGGFGLQGARERLEALRGSLTVSGSPLGGTRLRAVIPRSG